MRGSIPHMYICSLVCRQSVAIQHVVVMHGEWPGTQYLYICMGKCQVT